MALDQENFGGPNSIPFLSWIASWFNNFATSPLEFLPFSSVLPLTGFTVLHSLRIAYLYHSVLSSHGVQVGSRKGDVSFLQAGLVCTTLVMSGTTMAAILRGESSPLLAQGSGELVAAYGLAGVLMKWLHPFLSQLPQPALQFLFFFVDGFATSFGTLSLGLIPVLSDPRMTTREGAPLVLPTLILPLLCGSGASLLVPFFGLFQPRFTFGHPGFLSEKLSVDFWGPWLITLLYGTIVDGRGLLFGRTRHLLGLGVLSSKFPGTSATTSAGAWMRPDEAHVLCSLVLTFAYISSEVGPKFFDSLLKRSSLDLKDEPSQSINEKDALQFATGVQLTSGQLSKRAQTQVEQDSRF